MSTFSIIDERKAPRHTAREPRVSYNIDRDTKRCKTCNRILPFRCFVPSGHFIKRLGRRSGSNDCRDCQAKQRQAAGIQVRHQRINGRGEVWCNNCKRYLPTSEFKRHPTRPHLWWTFCMPCTRELDRMRYRAKARTASGRAAIRAAHNRSKRRKAAEDARERRAFMAETIDLLRRRGLTRSEIGRLTGSDLGNIYAWEKRERRMPRPSVMARFEALVRLTMAFPLGPPAFRRRLPHPHYAELEAAMSKVRIDVAAQHRRRGS